MIMPEHVPNTVLYNRFLSPPHNTTTVPDSHGGRVSGQALIDQDVGWDWAPSPKIGDPGVQVEPVEYAPVTEQSEDKPKTVRSTGGKPPKEGTD